VSIPVLDGTAVPTYFDEGIPYEAGRLAVDLSSAIQHYHMGLPFTANSRLAVSTANPVRFNSGATPFDAAGRLCMSSLPVDHYSAGIPYVSTGGIAAEGLAPFLGSANNFTANEPNSNIPRRSRISALSRFRGFVATYIPVVPERRQRVDSSYEYPPSLRRTDGYVNDQPDDTIAHWESVPLRGVK